MRTYDLDFIQVKVCEGTPLNPKKLLRNLKSKRKIKCIGIISEKRTFIFVQIGGTRMHLQDA